MLPDIRLLVVAVLAAIAGISCGLGLFATFRVNHEPLLRLSEGGPPLQLALENRTASEIGFPIAARLPVNAEVKPISAPALIPTPPATDSSQASTGFGLGLGPSDSAPAATPDNSEVAGPGAAEDGSIATTPATSAIQSSEAQPAAESATTSEQQAGATASKVVVAVANEAAVDERSIGEDQPPAAKPSETPDVMLAKTEAAATLAAMPAENPATETPAVTPAKTRATKTPAKTQATVARAPVRRAAKAVRIRRAPTTAAAQATGQYAQATYQYAQTQAAYQWIDPNVQASQTARRVVVKRHHAVKKTAPPAQSSLTGATALGPQ